ncbi:MAG: hypothetical protein ACYC3G_03510 [Minisyncoccota bacterium]
MPEYIQVPLILLGMGLIAFSTIMIAGIICFNFPRKCEKCGKLRAFIVTRWDKTQYYTAGGFLVTEYKFCRKICISCGYESREELEFKSEKLVRG